MIRVRVGVVLIESGRVLLVRHEKNGHVYWLLPGGGVEHGEGIVAAARREVLEETGFTVESERLLFVSESLSPDGGHHRLHLTFLARIVAGTLTVTCDERLVGANYFGPSQLPDLDLRPPLQGLLAAGMEDGFTQPPMFLGALWTPEDGRR